MLCYSKNVYFTILQKLSVIIIFFGKRYNYDSDARLLCLSIYCNHDILDFAQGNLQQPNCCVFHLVGMDILTRASDWHKKELKN